MSTEDACGPLRNDPRVTQAVLRAVASETGEKEKNLSCTLRRCNVQAGGGIEGSLVATVRGNAPRAHTFRVAMDRDGQTVSVRPEAVHFVLGAGTGARGADRGGKKMETKTIVWIAVGSAVAIAVVASVAAVVAKRVRRKVTPTPAVAQ